MNQEDIYSLEWTNSIKTLGRVFVYNGIMWLSYSGTGIEFVCEGGFKAALVGDLSAKNHEDGRLARYCVFKDGECILDERLNEASKSIGIKAEGRHIFRLIKVSESEDSSLGIASIEGLGGAITQTEPSKLKLECVGDSITCGYGVEGHLGEVYTTATENVSKAWSYLTAQKLGADYSIVSKSGSGIISGYTATGERNTLNILPPLYDRMGCSVNTIKEGVRPQDFEYDYSFEPDVIAICLGTNDMSYCHPVDEQGSGRLTAEEEAPRRRQFYDEYKEFILHVRKMNPFAKIVCMLGIMGVALNHEVEMVVKDLSAGGDQRIFFLALENQSIEDGYGTDYHPSPVTQEKMASKVADFISNIA